MVWLPDGENILMICLFILTESTNVTDAQTDGQTPHGDMSRLHSIARQKANKVNKSEGTRKVGFESGLMLFTRNYQN